MGAASEGLGSAQWCQEQLLRGGSSQCWCEELSDRFRNKELSSSLSAVAFPDAVGSSEGSCKTPVLVGADVPIAGEAGGAIAVLPYLEKGPFCYFFSQKCLSKEEQLSCSPQVKPYVLHSCLWRTANRLPKKRSLFS